MTTTTNNSRADALTFRKKPIAITAVQFTHDMAMGHVDLPEGVQFGGRNCHPGRNELHSHSHYVQTLEGRMSVEVGDWIITGVKGERYSCKPDIFSMTYEPVEQHEAAPAGERIAHLEALVQRYRNMVDELKQRLHNVTHPDTPSAPLEGTGNGADGRDCTCGMTMGHTRTCAAFDESMMRADPLLAPTPAADERAAPTLSEQDIYDKFSFLEGLVSEQTYVLIADTAIEIYGAARASSPNAAGADGRPLYERLHTLMPEWYPDAWDDLLPKYRDAYATAALSCAPRTDVAEAAHCQCPACCGGVIHASDCAVHNAPALPRAPCDCGVGLPDSEGGEV
ncbi:hypothetical protein KPA93_24815 [Burkholderia cenocepacia]|uniref:hypothetical protein n=1 Tax=Burkholderia cenocepacia TaxID=95486 RepID=UPI0028645B4A|nr:hypothetical protein [Burkholderia cenocepacia]MDR8026463.1 hypothetical protein [Burkholderia cenocepacia]MDR8043704.1 hypothetical protein [Burkholderia cenocepacia]